jgi:hypothetical protein
MENDTHAANSKFEGMIGNQKTNNTAKTVGTKLPRITPGNFLPEPLPVNSRFEDCSLAKKIKAEYDEVDMSELPKSENFCIPSTREMKFPETEEFVDPFSFKTIEKPKKYIRGSSIEEDDEVTDRGSGPAHKNK